MQTNFRCGICGQIRRGDQRYGTSSYEYSCWNDYTKARYQYKKVGERLTMEKFRNLRRRHSLPTIRESEVVRGRPRKGYDLEDQTCGLCKSDAVRPYPSDTRVCLSCGKLQEQLSKEYSFLTVDHMLGLEEVEGFSWFNEGDKYYRGRRIITAFIEANGENFKYEPEEQ